MAFAAACASSSTSPIGSEPSGNQPSKGPGTPGSTTPGDTTPGDDGGVKVDDAGSNDGSTQSKANMKPLAPMSAELKASLEKAGVDLNAKTLSEARGGSREKNMAIMSAFNTALGVKCSACHTSDTKAETEGKKIARKMWSEFVGKLSAADGSPIFCDSCHQGSAKVIDDKASKEALSAWMAANYVKGLKRKDGDPNSCATCHGTPFVGPFVDTWKN